MLCDSVGIEPRPNNGTLRLPLKSTGLHRPEDYPEAPEDPAIERPTVPALADPARPTAPPNSNKDSSGKPPPAPPADEKKPPASEDKEQPPPPPPSDEKGQGGGQDGEGDKHKGGFLGGIWGWMTDKVHKVTDKVHEVWDTVAGSG